MYLIECVNAYLALEGLMQKELDFGTAHALVMLRRELEPHVQFFGAEERKLAKEYAELDEAGELKLSDGGRFEMRAGADAAEYERRRRELGMVEVEDIKPRRAGNIGAVKPAVLEALSAFLEFEGEGDNPSTVSHS